MATKKTEKYYYAYGRRKTATATVRIFESKGENTINGKKANEIYNKLSDQKDLYSPFRSTETYDDFYFTAKVSGGGKSGQRDAIKLAIARALIEFNPEFRSNLKADGLLTVDDRVKERKKPGMKKARKKEQYSKR